MIKVNFHENDLVKIRIGKLIKLGVIVTYPDISMVKHPEGLDLLGKAGRDCKSMAERLEEVVFTLQEICHVQDKIHELQYMG